MKIRPYTRHDRTAVQDICVETSFLKEDTPIGRAMLTALYSDYYTDMTDNTFVATQDGQVVGYILAADDFQHFRDSMKKLYLPLVKKLNYKQYVSQLYVLKLFGKIQQKGVAHMHIDITESCQRMGVGRQLLNALASHLIGKGLHSVVLLCASNNVKGCNFYRKYGFIEQSRHFGCTLFSATLSNLLAKTSQNVVQ